MKRILNILAVAMILPLLASCGAKTSGNEAADEVAVLSVDELIANPETYVDSLVTFEGVCSHLCPHGGTKLFVVAGDGSGVLRVEAAEIGSFDQNCIHNAVKITGRMREQRIDEAYLQAWAAQAAEEAALEGDEAEEGEVGCDTENAARGIGGKTVEAQIAEYRAKIAERDSTEGKPYLSYYFVEAESYEIPGAE